jgi:hypothetical protein
LLRDQYAPTSSLFKSKIFKPKLFESRLFSRPETAEINTPQRATREQAADSPMPTMQPAGLIRAYFHDRSRLPNRRRWYPITAAEGSRIGREFIGVSGFECIEGRALTFKDRIEAKWIDASCEVLAKCTASLPTAGNCG